MNAPQDNERNNTAYRQMKQTIDASYPPGWFVAIADGGILAAAADFHELEGTLRAQGKDPRNILVVEAGVEYPDFAGLAGLPLLRLVEYGGDATTFWVRTPAGIS